MVNNEVAAMLVVHVDDIKIAATKQITDSVVADLNKTFPTKHLGEVTCFMGSEYKKDREKGTLEISQTQFIRNVVERLGITKTIPIPASPSLDLRHVSDEDPAVDAIYREMVGSLMWIVNQTRPDMANAVRAVARFSRDPKEVHVEAARKIIEYLSASAHLGLTFRKDSELDIYMCSWITTWRRTWTRTTPTRPTIGVRSLAWLSVAGVHLCRGFLGHRNASPYQIPKRST